MTGDVTLPTPLTMNLSKKRNVKRTSERTVSLIMRRLPSMRLLRSAELLLSRTVIFRDLKFVQLNMNLSVGPNRNNMMSLMMLFLVQLSRMRSVLMRLLVTPPSPSAPSGLEKCVLLLAVDLRKEQSYVMRKPVPLCRMLPRKNVALSPREPAVMLQNLSLNFILLRNVLMYLRRSVPDQEPTQER